MSKSGVSLNWGGFKEAVDQAASEISDTQGLMTKIGQAMKGQTVRRFQADVGPDGEAWSKEKRLATWQSAALLRASGWADDKQVSEAEFNKALNQTMNRRQGGNRK